MGANINELAEVVAQENEFNEIDMFFENGFDELELCEHDVQMYI